MTSEMTAGRLQTVNPRGDDQGDAVADAVSFDLLAQPHEKHAAGGEDDHAHEGKQRPVKFLDDLEYFGSRSRVMIKQRVNQKAGLNDADGGRPDSASTR